MLAFISPCYGHDPRDFTPIKRLRVRLIDKLISLINLRISLKIH